MSDYFETDYASLAKTGFLLGVVLFLLGGAGEVVWHAYVGSLPQWEATLFFDMEVIGVLAALLSPLVFGVVVPLVE